MNDQDAHDCDFPDHGTWNTFPMTWKCPECGAVWYEEIFSDEDGVYWTRDYDADCA